MARIEENHWLVSQSGSARVAGLQPAPFIVAKATEEQGVVVSFTIER
jgi:hypothetical protein